MRSFLARLKGPGADKTRACRPLIWPQVVPDELRGYHTVTSGMKNTDILQSVGVSVLQKSLKFLTCVSLEGEPGPYPEPAQWFLGCSSLVSVFPPFPG